MPAHHLHAASVRSKPRLRTLLVLIAFLAAWFPSLLQSIEASRNFTTLAGPATWYSRYAPLRDPVQSVRRADFLSVPGRPDKAKKNFWMAQFVLAPTILERLSTPQQALKRSVQVDPHHLVVELPVRAELVRFERRYRRLAAREGRVVRAQDFGNGLRLIESHGRP